MENKEYKGIWYDISLKQPGFLADKDYQNYVLFKMFQYVNVVDVSLMEPPYHHVEALFDSRDHAEFFCRENGEFVQSIKHSVDREILTQRTYMEKVGDTINVQFII